MKQFSVSNSNPFVLLLLLILNLPVLLFGNTESSTTNTITCSGDFSVSVTVDNSHPQGYCDIVTYHIAVFNSGTDDSFTGRIEYNPNDFMPIDPYATPVEIDLSTSYIYFDIGAITHAHSGSFEYKMIIKAYDSYIWKTKNTITRACDGLTRTVDSQSIVDAHVYKPIPSPGYSSYYASDLISDYENGGLYGGPFTILPVDPAPSSDDYACNEDHSQSLYIADQLIFDIPDYCIYNGDSKGGIIVEEGGQIIVLNGSKLLVDGQTIKSCHKMWKGFYVESGGQLIINNCTIENAQYGIQAERGATISVRSSVFLNNFIGIYVAPYNSGPEPYPSSDPASSFVNLAGFSNNTFIGVGDMLPGYTGQSPAPSSKPYAGIEVYDLSSFVIPGYAISSTEASVNYFENLANGIIAIQTSLYANETYFKDITRDPEVSYALQGYGICISEGKLFTEPPISHGRGKFSQIIGNTIGFQGEKHFNNCDIGIFNDREGIEVNGVTMENVKNGILVYDAKNREISITNNNIQGFDKGIVLNHCVPIEGKINHNIIEIGSTNDYSSCIEMNDYPIPTHWQVEFNSITLHDGKYGIINRDGLEVSIMNNTITVDPYIEDYDEYGVFLEGSKNALVTCNSVNGDIEPLIHNYHLSTGIFFQGANGFNIGCNEVSNFLYGVKASGENSGGSLLRGNSLGSQWDGLFLGSSAVIGEQNQLGNSWNGTYYNYGAVHKGSAAVVLQSLFFYDDNDNPKFKPPSISESYGKWFTYEPGTSFFCSDTFCPEGIGYYHLTQVWDSLDYKYVLGNLGFENFDNSLSWMGRFNTYRRLHNGSPVAFPTAISTFLSNQASLNIGKFSNALDSIHYALRYYGPFEDIFEDYPASLSKLFNNINNLDRILLTEISAKDSITDLITEKLDSIFLFENNFSSKDSLVKIILGTRAENAKVYIEAISPDSSWQDLLQFTLLEFLHLAKTDSLLSSTDLYDLALNCPDKYGDPVYYARSLIRVDSLINAYDDDGLCSYIHQRSPNQSDNTLGVLFPNPAENFVQISSDRDILKLQVYDISGKIVPIEYQTIRNSVFINITNLVSGVYYVRTWNDLNAMQMFTFVVAK